MYKKLKANTYFFLKKINKKMEVINQSVNSDFKQDNVHSVSEKIKNDKEEMNDISEIVRKETEIYWQNNDYYNHFIEDCIKMVYYQNDPTKLDLSVSISINDLYDAFKNWFRFSFPSCINKTPNLPQFREAIEKKWGKPFHKSWRGVEIKKWN